MLNKKRNTKKIKKSKSFLLKLFDILNDNKYKDIIHWDFEGTTLIIENIDNLCNMVLPKYYIHSNYNSFIRQLNIYGFSKAKGIKNGEGFKNTKFNKYSSNEQISQIGRKGKKIKFLSNFIKDRSKNNSLDKNEHNNHNLSNNIYTNENDVIKLLIEKNKKTEENIKNLIEEKGELKAHNQNLNNEIFLFKNNIKGQNIYLEKFILLKKDDKNNKKQKREKIQNIKELFKRYLYDLKIYSPFLITNDIIDNSKSSKKIKDKDINETNYKLKDINFLEK